MRGDNSEQRHLFHLNKSALPQWSGPLYKVSKYAYGQRLFNMMWNYISKLTEYKWIFYCDRMSIVVNKVHFVRYQLFTTKSPWGQENILKKHILPFYNKTHNPILPMSWLGKKRKLNCLTVVINLWHSWPWMLMA